MRRRPFFKAPALGIGAVQNAKIFVAVMVAQLHFSNGIGYKPALIIICKRAHQTYLFAFRIISPQVFGYLVLVFRDDVIGHLKYALGAAVVFAPASPTFYIIIIFLKLEDIFYGSTSKAVDALGIIAHHADVFMHGTQQFYYFILGGVGNPDIHQSARSGKRC